MIVVSRSRAQPSNTRRRPNVGLMLDQRLRRWPNNNTLLGQRLVLAGHCSRQCDGHEYKLTRSQYGARHIPPVLQRVAHRSL